MSLLPSQWQRLQSSREESTTTTSKTITGADRTRTMSADLASDVADKEELLDPIAVAFHDRYVLLEKSIEALFRDDHPCCIPDPSVTLLDLEDHDMPDAHGPLGTSKSAVAAAPAARRVEEDEYDDEESEEEDDRKPATPPSLKHSSAMRTTLSPSTKGPMAAEANVVVNVLQLMVVRTPGNENLD